MSKFLTLLGREVKSYFCSPTAYIVLFFFLLLTGFNFYMDIALLSRGPTEVTIVEGFFNSVPFWIGFILIFPPITMRAFSEEFRMGTIDMLMTAPVRDWQVVFSKFFGAVIFYIVLWAPSVLYFLFFERITGIPAANASGAWGSYLFLLLAGLLFISIGCLASVMTQNQIVAAVISFCLLTLFFFGGLLTFFTPNASPLFRELVNYVSTLEHMSEFSRGIIDSRRVVFYLSMTALMLVLTHQIFLFRRWRA